MYFLRNRSFFGVTSSQARECHRWVADLLVSLTEASMVVLLLCAWTVSWMMKCVFPSYTGHNLQWKTQDFRCSFRISISFPITLKPVFTLQSAKSRLKILDLSLVKMVGLFLSLSSNNQFY